MKHLLLALSAALLLGARSGPQAQGSETPPHSIGGAGYISRCGSDDIATAPLRSFGGRSTAMAGLELVTVTRAFGSWSVVEVSLGGVVLAQDVRRSALQASGSGDLELTEEWCHRDAEGNITTVRITATVSLGGDVNAAFSMWREAVEAAKQDPDTEPNVECPDGGGDITTRYAESWMVDNPGACSTVTISYSMSPTEVHGKGFELWRSGVELALSLVPPSC